MPDKVIIIACFCSHSKQLLAKVGAWISNLGDIFNITYMHPVKVFQPLSQYVSQSDDLARIDYKMREGYIVSEFLRNPQKIQLRYCNLLSYYSSWEVFSV